jgi:DNA (cytosine-5)-methyltransferase 1
MRPRLLDLFCGAGGCSVGYARAGFEVVGVDIAPQPNYPYEFHQAHAAELLRDLLDAKSTWSGSQQRRMWLLSDFDAIHASPPCQAHVKGFAAVNRARGRELGHTDLIAGIRELLIETSLPYVIENVEGAPLLNPVKLCGSSFGLAVQRHRLFESNVALMAPPCAHHLQREAKYPTNWRPNGEKRLAKVVQVYGNAAGTDLWPDAMGIYWMTTEELAEAIPPAYTEHVGGYLRTQVMRDTLETFADCLVPPAAFSDADPADAAGLRAKEQHRDG